LPAFLRKVLMSCSSQPLKPSSMTDRMDSDIICSGVNITQRV
jgi:hypothetical protein